MIRQFGLLLAVGIAVICFASIILPLATLGIREYQSPTKGGDFSEGYLGRFVVRLGSLPAVVGHPAGHRQRGHPGRRPVRRGRAELQTDPIQWVNQESQTIKDIREVEEQVGSSSEFGVFFRADDVFTDEFTQYAHDFAGRCAGRRTPTTSSRPRASRGPMGGLLQVPGASDIAPTGEEVRGRLRGRAGRHPGRRRSAPTARPST